MRGLDDELLVDEGQLADAAHFAPVARQLDAAEGQLRQRSHEVVDVDHAGLDARSNFRAVIRVAGEKDAAQPVGVVVGERHRLLLGMHAVHGCDRSEHLALVRRIARVDVGEDGRAEELAVGVDFGVLVGEFRACSNRIVKLVLQLLLGTLGVHRRERGGRVERVAGLDGSEVLLERVEEFVVDVVHHDEALRRGAHLPAVVEPHAPGEVGDILHVRIAEHDEGIHAAKLHRVLLEVLAGRLGDRLAAAFGAGQRNALHARVGNGVRDLIVGQEQVRQRPLRHAGLLHDFAEALGCGRRVRRMLENHRVADHVVRREDAHDLVVREVPRLDHHDDAHRMMPHFGLASRNRLDRIWLEQLFTVIGEPVRDDRAQLHFAGRFADQLAHVDCANLGKLVGMLAQRRSDLVQQRATLGDRLRLELLVALSAERQSVLQLAVSGERILRDDFVGIGIDCLIRHDYLLVDASSLFLYRHHDCRKHGDFAHRRHPRESRHMAGPLHGRSTTARYGLLLHGSVY